jgi:hypothetical protein
MQIPRRASIFSNEDENDDKKILTTVILTVFVLGACAEGQEKQGLGTLVGTKRTKAARMGSVGLQVIRDWVLRFNARGPEGLIDGQAPGQAV